MRTPSRSAFIFAMGLVATTSAAGIVGISAANASPEHARSAPAAVTMTVPGTGVAVTTDMDDQGDVTGTTAGDDVNDQNETEANDVNDNNGAPEPAATEAEHHDRGTAAGDGNGQDASDDTPAADA